MKSSVPSSDEIEARLHNSLKNRPGVILWLDIINKCNLRCIMCHFSNDDVFHKPVRCFTPEEFNKFFLDIAPYVREINLSCGAEPLTSKYFPEILSIVSDYPTPIEISFCTNAMLLSPKIRSLLIQKGVTRVMLSMDGVTKSTVERIRVGTKYEHVVGNIIALRDLKEVSGSQYPILTLNFVMMNLNIHEAPIFVELAKRLGAKNINFQHVVSSDYWNDQNEMLSNHKAKYN